MSKQLFRIPPLGVTVFMPSIEYERQQEAEREARRQLRREEYERLALWDEDYLNLRKKKKARDKDKGELSEEEIKELFPAGWKEALLEISKREGEYPLRASIPHEDYHAMMAQCEYFFSEWGYAKSMEEREQLRERSRLKTLLFYAKFFHFENTGEEKDVSDGA